MRIFSMFCIIAFHSLCCYANNWWILHIKIIPLWKVIALPNAQIGLSSFFLISGFLFGFHYIEKGKYRIISSFIYNKTQRIIIPYLFWSLFLIAIFSIIPWHDILIGTAHLWFLLTLFELFIIIIVLSKLLCRTNFYIDLIIIALAFITLYVWKIYIKHHFFLSIENTLYFLPAFLLGFYCAKYKFYHTSKRKTSATIFITTIITIFILSFLSPIKKTPWGIELAIRLLSCVTAVSALVMLCNIIIPNKYISLINNLDHNSMGIYIFNQIVVFVVLMIPVCRQFLEIHYLIGPSIIFFVSFLIPWGLAILFNKTKYLSWMIGT